MQLGIIDFSEKHANIGTVVWATVPNFSPPLSTSSVPSTDRAPWGHLAKCTETGPGLSTQSSNPHPVALWFSRSPSRPPHGPAGQPSVPSHPSVCVLSFSSLPSPSVPIAPGHPTTPSPGRSMRLPKLSSYYTPPKASACCSLSSLHCVLTILSALQSAFRILSFHSPYLFMNRPPRSLLSPHDQEAMI